MVRSSVNLEREKHKKKIGSGKSQGEDASLLVLEKEVLQVKA